MSYSAIFTAIDAIITATLPATLAIQRENEFIDATSNAPYARITHLPATPTVATLGTTGSYERPGLTQIDIFTRAGAGTTTYPDDLVAAFGRSVRLTTTGADTYELIARREGGSLVEDGWWQTSVIVAWRSLTSF